MDCPVCKTELSIDRETDYQLQVLKGSIPVAGILLKADPVKFAACLIPVNLGICQGCGLMLLFATKVLVKKKKEEKDEPEEKILPA